MKYFTALPVAVGIAAAQMQVMSLHPAAPASPATHTVRTLSRYLTNTHLTPTGHSRRPQTRRNRNGARPRLRTRVHHRKRRRRRPLRLHAEEPHSYTIDVCRAVPQNGRGHGLGLYAESRG